MANEWLWERFNEYDRLEAIADNDQSCLYRDMLQEYHRWRAVLVAQQIQPGEVVILESDFTIRSFALLLALIENRNVIVPLTNINPEYRSEYLAITEADRIVNLSSQGFEITTGHFAKTNELLKRFGTQNEPGLILFTSGSSGKPKAALHNFTQLLNKYRPKKKSNRTLLFLLFDHIGGINTMFHTLANGGTIIRANGKEIDSICGQIEKHRVELLPATPSFLTLLLLSEAYRNHDLSSLQLITYGTEPMPDSLLVKLTEALPQVRFKQTYGTSEVGILRIRSKSSDSTWVKLDTDEYGVKIVDNTLYIKADTAMEGYLNAPTPFDEDGWYNTQDKVEVDGEFIKILGRESDLINVGGFKVFPAEIEDLILQMPGIKNAVVFGEKSALTGNIVAVKVNISTNEDEISLKRRIRDFCKDKLKPFMIPAKVYIVETELFGARFKKLRH